MECYRVRVPPGTRLAGYTAAGRRVEILPGEYHVHRMRTKLPARGVHALRFVGAYGGQADIHLPLGEGSDIRRVLPPEVSAVESDSR